MAWEDAGLVNRQTRLQILHSAAQHTEFTKTFLTVKMSYSFTPVNLASFMPMRKLRHHYRYTLLNDGDTL